MNPLLIASLVTVATVASCWTGAQILKWAFRTWSPEL